MTNTLETTTRPTAPSMLDVDELGFLRLQIDFNSRLRQVPDLAKIVGRQCVERFLEKKEKNQEYHANVPAREDILLGIVSLAPVRRTLAAPLHSGVEDLFRFAGIRAEAIFCTDRGWRKTVGYTSDIPLTEENEGSIIPAPDFTWSHVETVVDMLRTVDNYKNIGQFPGLSKDLLNFGLPGQ